MAIKLNPQCGDPLDKCFARSMGACTVLTSTCDRKPCPFKKDRKTYTSGVHYPYNPASSVEHEVMSRKGNK